jgi:hypothetical protein
VFKFTKVVFYCTYFSPFFLLFFFFFGVGGQGLAKLPGLVWYSQSSALHLLSAGITVLHHHAWLQLSFILRIFFRFTQIVVRRIHRSLHFLVVSMFEIFHDQN